MSFEDEATKLIIKDTTGGSKTNPSNSSINGSVKYNLTRIVILHLCAVAFGGVFAVLMLNHETGRLAVGMFLLALGCIFALLIVCAVRVEYDGGSFTYRDCLRRKHCYSYSDITSVTYNRKENADKYNLSNGKTITFSRHDRGAKDFYLTVCEKRGFTEALPF